MQHKVLMRQSLKLMILFHLDSFFTWIADLLYFKSFGVVTHISEML